MKKLLILLCLPMIFSCGENDKEKNSELKKLVKENNEFKQLKEQLKQLKEQQEFYKAEIEKDSTKVYNLNNNPEEQERFARERFLMKKDNEDVFIVRDKKEDE